MEGLGVAANVIAVVELSAKFVSLCLQYSKDVKNARADIARLERKTINLKEVSESVQGLLQGPNGARLEASHKLVVAVNDSLYLED